MPGTISRERGSNASAASALSVRRGHEQRKPAERLPARCCPGMPHIPACLHLHKVQAQAPLSTFMDRLTIGMLAVATGVKITTIRYYERAGLMVSPPRSAGGHRNYTNVHRQRLLFIRKARQLEFSIQDIRSLLLLAEPAGPSCREVQRVAAAHLQELRRKISALAKLEALLAGAVAHCSGNASPPCPVLELLNGAD